MTELETQTTKCAAYTIAGEAVAEPRQDNNLAARLHSRLAAFTLAEVLITLAIIGVVAAMTIPTLISSYEKKVVVTRLQKFDSMFNQAIKLSEVENGQTASWEGSKLVNAFDPDALYDWYIKYFDKYIKSQDIKKISDGIIVTLYDGSSFGLYNTSRNNMVNLHAYYFVNSKTTKEFIEKNKIHGEPTDGKNSFLFVKQNNESYIRPYDIRPAGTEFSRDLLINGGAGVSYECAGQKKFYCAALIKYDGWKIKDDYPVKF